MPLQLAIALTTLSQGPLQLRTGIRAELTEIPASPKATSLALTNLLADNNGDDDERSMKDKRHMT
jgi:hypothetical protein